MFLKNTPSSGIMILINHSQAHTVALRAPSDPAEVSLSTNILMR